MSQTSSTFRSRFADWLDRPRTMGLLILITVGGIALLATTPYSNIGILSGFALVLFLAFMRPQGFRHLGFRAPESWKRTFLIAIFLALVLELGSSTVIEPLFENLLNEKIDLSAFDALRGDIVNTAIMLAIGWIVGGFLEEMFFRGFLLQEIGRLFGSTSFGFLIGLLVSSTLFGMSHFYQGAIGMIMTGLMGLFLGAIYLFCKRNLWVAVLTHGFVDTVGITLIYLGKYEALRDIFPI